MSRLLTSARMSTEGRSERPGSITIAPVLVADLHVEMDPRLRPLSGQHFGIAGIDILVDTHLPGDHHGGNQYLSAGGDGVVRPECA